MQNIGLKFKTVGRGLAERFVFIPRPRNVFSLFAKIPLFSPLSLFFAYLRIFDFSLRSFFFSILRAYARSEFYLSRGERNRRIIRSDLAPLPSFRPDTKIFNPHVLVTTERGKKCKRSFRDFFLPLPPLPIFAMVYAMVMGNSFDRLRSAVICSDFQQECCC